MKVLYSEIEIRASAERVWTLLTDFDNFPKWNPFIRRVRGEPKVGQQLEVFIRPRGTDGITFHPTVLKAQPNCELRWLGHFLIPGLFDGEHIFAIAPLSKNRVRFIQKEIFRGLLVPLLAKKIDSNTRQGFEKMNQALKIRSEVLANRSY